MRDSGQALPTLVPAVFSFLTTPLHRLHPLGRRGFGLMRQPGVLDEDACRRSGQATDAGIWPARGTPALDVSQMRPMHTEMKLSGNEPCS